MREGCQPLRTLGQAAPRSLSCGKEPWEIPVRPLREILEGTLGGSGQGLNRAAGRSLENPGDIETALKRRAEELFVLDRQRYVMKVGRE